MTAPARPPDPTALGFVQTVARSRLIDPRRLADIVNGIPEPDREAAPRLAEHLIAGGHLTHFQVQKLMLGLWQGLVLGPYHVLAPLGRGGMGTVYLAQKVDGPPDPHSPVTDLVALKVLPPKKAREEEKTLARFRREMDIGKHLDHPNVTRTLDAGVAEGVHFLAMEYVPGETLRQTVVRGGPLGVADAARVFADVTAGLAHAHARGLIHRDLKPSNIMVTPDGRAKVLDLGLALVVGEQLPADPSIVGGKGYALGTMDYIAPEQTADASDVGPAADLYSLGCSLYFTLTGAPPFPGGTAQQKIRWHRTETPPPVTQLNPSVPPAFAAIVECLLAKRPDHRPNGAEAVRMMLLPWAGDHVTRSAGADHAPHDAGEAVAEVDTRSYAPTLWDTATAVLPEPLPDPDPDPPPGISLPPSRMAVLAVGVILAALAMAGLGLVVGLYAAARR